MEHVLGVGEAAGNQPVYHQRSRLGWRGRDGPVHYAKWSKPAIARRGGCAGIQRSHGHLRRREWETGRRTITIVTSSGTNQLHGSVFEYLRNSALDSRNSFD